VAGDSVSEVSRLTDPPVERIDALFVQSATSFTSAPGTITLHGLADSTVYFADRPRREIGHIASLLFVELWSEDASNLAADPPNAVLSFLDENGDAPEDVVLVLREPRLTGRTISYRVEILEGSLPRRFGPCALFIDMFARPLAPAVRPGRPHRKRKPVKSGS